MHVPGEEDEEDSQPMTQSFIDDSQATHVAPGYDDDEDEENVPPPKRRAKSDLIDDEAVEDNSEVEFPDEPSDDTLVGASREIEEMMERKVKRTEKFLNARNLEMASTKWGDVVDFSKVKGSSARKLEDRRPVGAKFMLPARQFVWNEMRTLSNAEKGTYKKYGAKSKFGNATEENEFPNLIYAREYKCSKTGKDKLYEFNIPYQYFPHFMEAAKMKEQEMIELGYL